MTTEKNFPNGFTSWAETHYEVVQAMCETFYARKRTGVVAETHNESGTGGLYELAEDLTDEFEKQYEGHEWAGDYFDTIESWLNEKLK